MNELFGLPYYSTNEETTNAITPQNLYGNMGTINTKYNSFENITDFIRYLMNHVVVLSALGNIVSLFKSTIDATSENLIDYYTTEKNHSLELIDKIRPYSVQATVNKSSYIKYSELEDIVRNVYENKGVNFAWIHEIGHYIIDDVRLMIDDMVVDTLTGEFLHFIYKTEMTESKLIGYNKIIGNVSSLYTYNNTKKCKYTLYIPLPFTFSKFYESSLPLVCLNFSDVHINVRLKEFDDVAYYPPLTKFNKNPKLKCNVIGNYIYLENDNRMKVAKTKHDMLMETIQSNGTTLINLNDTDTVMVQLNFCTLSKELYIACRLDEYIDGSQPNGEKKWNNYLVRITNSVTMKTGETVITYLDVNPIETMQIRYNGRERESAKDSVYYECIQKYDRHTRAEDDGINIYSFALHPEQLQPSGNANLGRIGSVDLLIKFKDSVVQYMRKTKKTMHINIYNKGINILRVMSGLAGLAYFE
jgi:hypothetical protein